MSYNTSAICVLCKQKPSITSCEGCHRKLCSECFPEHRRELSLELDDLVNRRNEICEIINNNTTDTCRCFDEIKRWQQEMHANIDRIASTAQDNVRQILFEASKHVRSGLDQVSQELQLKRKNDAYVEGDLRQMKQQLTTLNDTVRQLNEQVQLDTTASRKINWNLLIFVVPNRNSQIHTTATTTVPPSPQLYSSTNQSKSNIIKHSPEVSNPSVN